MQHLNLVNMAVAIVLAKVAMRAAAAASAAAAMTKALSKRKRKRNRAATLAPFILGLGFGWCAVFLTYLGVQQMLL
jgi:hypothetical protein